MTVPDAVTLLSLLASGVFLVRLLPQPVRLARTGVSEGVSATAALNGVVIAAAWVVYGLGASLTAVWIVSALALVPGVWAVWLLRHRTTGSDLAWTAAVTAILALAGVAGHFGLALAAGVLVTQGPQVWEAVRQDDLSGLAPSTWWMSIVDATTWGAYGLALGDATLVGYAVVLSSSAAIVLGRIWWTTSVTPAEVAEAITS